MESPGDLQWAHTRRGRSAETGSKGDTQPHHRHRAAYPAVSAAKSHPPLSKIVIGRHQAHEDRAPPPHIKFTPIQAGLRMQVRVTQALFQISLFYTDRPDDVIREIRGEMGRKALRRDSLPKFPRFASCITVPGSLRP